MFGLMKARTCASNAQAAKLRRLHYCGTCKTMGSLYGQRARMLLNNDAVFLAELLTALSPEMPALEAWSDSLQSYNCMAMPRDEDQMPLPLQIAATATLVMSEFKVVDQVTDSANRGWKMIGKIYSQSFLDATARMRSWEFPVQEMWDWNRVQQVREAEALCEKGSRTADAILNATAEPTAVVTGLTFQHGARVVGAEATTQETMFALGHAFGSLIYVLDAYEDDTKDAGKGDFNALQAAYRCAGNPLNETQRSAAIDSLKQLTGQIEQCLQALPIPAKQAALFTNRLQANLAHKLGISPRRCSHSAVSTGAPASATERRERFARWKEAHATASGLVQQQRAECAGFLTTIQAPFLFVCLFLAALVFPRQAMAAASSRECLGMFLNLMFWGAAFKAVLTMPQRILAPVYPMSENNPMQGGIGHSSSGGAPTETVVTTVRQRRRIGCCCDCCDWECECCCDGCDCACCACESLECCSAGCDCCSSCS